MIEIVVDGISKSFSSGKNKVCKALDSISLETKEACIFGIIGPDGAGKTTFFRILSTLLQADSGNVYIDGLNADRDFRKIRLKIAYMPSRFSLYEDLSVEENLKFYATIYGTSIKENYSFIKSVYSYLEPFKERKTAQLSGGMKQKLALCCTLIHRPKYLFLDEPTNGVDPNSRKEFWDILQELRDEGMCIFASTPYMDEAVLCNKIALIDRGKLIACNTPQGLINSFSKDLYSIQHRDLFSALNAIRGSSLCSYAFSFGDAIHMMASEAGEVVVAGGTSGGGEVAARGEGGAGMRDGGGGVGCAGEGATGACGGEEAAGACGGEEAAGACGGLAGGGEAQAGAAAEAGAGGGGLAGSGVRGEECGAARVAAERAGAAGGSGVGCAAGCAGNGEAQAACAGAAAGSAAGVRGGGDAERSIREVLEAEGLECGGCKIEKLSPSIEDCFIELMDKSGMDLGRGGAASWRAEPNGGEACDGGTAATNGKTASCNGTATSGGSERKLGSESNLGSDHKTTPIIKLENLSKRFGDFVAVDKLSLEVKKGEIFGFLGANGSGKTTTMRMLSGLSVPSEGFGQVAGFDIYKESELIKKNIGYMSQKFSLYNDLSVLQNIRLFAGIYGMSRKEINLKAKDLLSRLNFEEYTNSLVGELPLGLKQKLAFSIAIFHEPKLVFLDEPTAGVDPVTRRKFWELIYESSRRGISVFVSTHYMDEAEYCNRICIMSSGKILVIGSPGELKAKYGASSINEIFMSINSRK